MIRHDSAASPAATLEQLRQPHGAAASAPEQPRQSYNATASAGADDTKLEGSDNHQGIVPRATELKQHKTCPSLSKRHCSLANVCTINDV
nr:hypothetical protein CFP56_38140 [Quercus suber]